MAMFRRVSLRLSLVAGGLVVLAGAGYLGYRRSLASAAAPPEAPATVTVTRGPVVLSVTAPGVVVDLGAMTVASPVDGSVEEIMLQPGQTFTRGQVLARLGGRPSFQAAVDAAQLQVLQAQQMLDQLRAGAPQAVAAAQQQLAQDEKDLQAAQRRLAGLAQPDVNFYQQQVAAAQSALTTAQENVQITSQGGLTVTLQSARQDLARATNIYNDALSAQSRCPDCPRVFAPEAGALVDVAQVKAQMAQAANTVHVLELQLAQAQRADGAAVTQAQQQVAAAQANLALARSNTPNPADMALAQADEALAQAKVSAARAAWQRLSNGPDPDNLRVDQATLMNAQDALAAAEANLSALDVRAPFDGIVLALSASPGQSVAAGAPLLTITRPGALEVQATVVEQDYPLVTPGQSVQVFFDALAGVSVSGRVARVIPQRSSTTQVLFPIAIQLDSLPDHLAAGMTADGSVVIDQRDSALRLPRSVAHVRADGGAEVRVWAGGQADTRSIQVGLRGDSFVEILSGLQEGEQVVVQ